jgi:hypothetical protein
MPVPSQGHYGFHSFPIVHYNRFISVLPTGTRVHFAIFVIFIKLNIFPFSASILTFSTQNNLILTYFTPFIAHTS